MKRTLLIALFSAATFLLAQDHHDRWSRIDIQHYRFALTLSDETDEIQGQAQVSLTTRQALRGLNLDLVAQVQNGKGMKVSQVSWEGKDLVFKQTGDDLNIVFASEVAAGEEVVLDIHYSGIPGDGLVISKNTHGDRTFFGDNWPNRARHWLPTVDHPSDKATVEFLVTAPNHYQVIANGEQIEETNLDQDLKLTHWRENVPLPTKVMVIGVAEFAVQHVGYVGQIPQSSWVFPEVREEGFYDYAQAVEILPWFIENVAPYPYEKMAHVQSKTRYGGMENAGNIFYYEGSVTGKRQIEALLAHEIAHQWFGNSASEANWHHVWLSEGFATYFTNLYLRHSHNDSLFRARLSAERNTVLQYTARQAQPRPIVDTTITDYNRVLSANTYQKAGFVLHMLHEALGDELWWQCIRTYYDRYQISNALSGDFETVVEEVSGRNYDAFFQQWFFTPGHPQLAGSWTYDKRQQQIVLTLEQKQETLFAFPIEIGVRAPGGKMKVLYFQFDEGERAKTFTILLSQAPAEIVLDPRVKLLFEGELVEK
jgi:aminopeptidase N